MFELDDEWESFMVDSHNNSNHKTKLNEPIEKLREVKDVPVCDPITISTKTKIVYLNVSIDLFHRFWDLPMIDYDEHKEGIIKKQIKFNFTSKEEVETFYKFVNKEPRIKDGKGITTLNKIDNPNGRIKFKDIKKIDIGFCKNDLLKAKKNNKSAFYNCYVIIYRAFINNKYKELHIKLFNTGKIEIPGVQNEEMVNIAVNKIKTLLQPHYSEAVCELLEKRETILINSNFSCNYYINRNKLFKILKKKNVKCSYDPCSYPGIQCKYILDTGEISYMIFRTGSVLIVGKCENEDLYVIYEFIKKIFYEEYHNIYENNNEQKIIKTKKIIKKSIYIEE
jgi:TATA-box binding protein (TBP) (component of TFIID and TFIIIB)